MAFKISFFFLGKPTVAKTYLTDETILQAALIPLTLDALIMVPIRF